VEQFKANTKGQQACFPITIIQWFT